ncbi:MAG: hypothetical protein ACI9CO_000020 [Candidatus Azotimanducaceae bacterium]|jgi:hypothetical protein
MDRSKSLAAQIQLIWTVTKYPTRAPSNYSVYFYKKLIGILSSSPKLLQRLEEDVLNIKSTQNQVLTIQLLMAIRGTTPDLSEIIQKTYTKQKRRKFPETIFDITTGQFSVAQHVLLNIAYNPSTF